MVRNSPANAGHGFDPLSGKISHAEEQLKQLDLELVLLKKKHHTMKVALQPRELPLATARKGAQQQDRTAKN